MSAYSGGIWGLTSRGPLDILPKFFNRIISLARSFFVTYANDDFLPASVILGDKVYV